MQRVLGGDHPDTLRLSSTLAVILGALKRAGQARQRGEDTLNRMGRVLGTDHPDVLRLAHDFGHF
jgi:hypothetical protein